MFASFFSADGSGRQMPGIGDIANGLVCSRRHACRMVDSGHMPPTLKLSSLARWSRAEADQSIQEGCSASRSREVAGQ